MACIGAGGSDARLASTRDVALMYFSSGGSVILLISGFDSSRAFCQPSLCSPGKLFCVCRGFGLALQY